MSVQQQPPARKFGPAPISQAQMAIGFFELLPFAICSLWAFLRAMETIDNGDLKPLRGHRQAEVLGRYLRVRTIDE